MAFLDKLGEVAKNMTEKANDSLEINRLNGEISIEKGNIQCFYRDLGEFYWAKYAVGEKLDDEAMLICDKVVVAQEHIKEMEADIERVKKERELLQAERAEKKRLEEERQAEEKAVETAEAAEVLDSAPQTPKFCASCGGELKEGQRFCQFCGKEVQ